MRVGLFVAPHHSPDRYPCAELRRAQPGMSQHRSNGLDRCAVVVHVGCAGPPLNPRYVCSGSRLLKFASADFLLSYFPLLIMFAAVVAYLPIHHLFGTALDFMGRFMPKDSMELVKTVLRDVITP